MAVTVPRNWPLIEKRPRVFTRATGERRTLQKRGVMHRRESNRRFTRRSYTSAVSRGLRTIYHRSFLTCGQTSSTTGSFLFSAFMSWENNTRPTFIEEHRISHLVDAVHSRYAANHKRLRCKEVSLKVGTLLSVPTQD